jgi:hypothetical protein
LPANSGDAKSGMCGMVCARYRKKGRDAFSRMKRVASSV